MSPFVVLPASVETDPKRRFESGAHAMGKRYVSGVGRGMSSFLPAAGPSRGRMYALSGPVIVSHFPSGDQWGSMTVWPVDFVSWVRPLPSVAIVQISYRPARSEWNARRFPSGEEAGARAL